MREFFEVVTLAEAAAHDRRFAVVGAEEVDLGAALGRVLAGDIVADADLPGFARSTMDGYAVVAASTFGASESQPALLEVVGSIEMGTAAAVAVGPGQAVGILTGGMMAPGSDAVVMVEHTEVIDDTTIEVVRAVAPTQNVIAADDDVACGETVLQVGTRLRAQEVGVLAALGHAQVMLYRQPRVAIISTGDEVVDVDVAPRAGQIRDVNSHTLAALVVEAGAVAVRLGIVGDDFDQLLSTCQSALADNDMVLLSGGSSVGARDLTIDVLRALPLAEVLVHGVAIRPGKPTILADVGGKALWGLPGHVASAMVVFRVLVRGFIERIAGLGAAAPRRTRARLSRNLASVHGRRDHVRVAIEERDGELWAIPVLGKSGLIRTMVRADGLVEIATDSEGLDQGSEVWVYPV